MPRSVHGPSSDVSPCGSQKSSISEMSYHISRSHSSGRVSPYVTRSQVISETPASESPQKDVSQTGKISEEESVLDLGSEYEESMYDTGSDFEETLRKRPWKSPSSSLKEPLANKRPRRAKENEAIFSDGSAGDLFNAIKKGKSAIQILVDEWLDGYKQNRETALLELINFLMQACGCKGVVTQEMLESMQNADIIRKMTEDFDEETSDYPLSCSSSSWKKFRLNFGEFLETLVLRSQFSIIYDDLLMDVLISLLTGMSDSQVRPFRHTSTFAAMKLMTGLVKVALNLHLHFNTTKRQYDVEQSKTLEKRATEKLESLLRKQKELRENVEEIGNLMNGIFKGVFVHRYCDTVTDIRAICMKEIGVWIKTYSQSFLNDSYLKYVGWNLHDKGQVRLQCVHTLHSIYSVQENAARLELFTSRFKDRMVCMVLDKEQQVAVEAINLLGLISKHMEDILSNEDCETVYPLVFSSSRAVSSAAGAFMYQRLLNLTATEESPGVSRHCTNTSFFRNLISFFIESELHEHAAYLVDSLWDCAGAQLRDCECQIDLLLTEKDGLDDTEESALIQILASVMRQAVEGTSPVGRVPAKKAVSAKDRKAQSEDKIRLTRLMIQALPHLLAKFQDLLVAQLREILEKHTEADVLEACSRAFYILCDREHTLHKNADIALGNIMDQLTDHFLQQLPEVLQVTDPDEDDVYNFAVTMKRISALYSAHDLSRWELFGPCSEILRKRIETGEVPDQIILPALTCCHFFLLWELSHFSNSNTQLEQLLSLKEKLRVFCEMCQGCLSDFHSSVRKQAFILLSDLLVIFGAHMPQGQRSHLQPLVHCPEQSLQAELAGFLLDHVFTEPEDEEVESEIQKIYMLHERRNLLAGYCKLILYSPLHLHSASDIFKHYVKFYTDYGDIIKETLQKSRRINKEESTRTVLLSLTQAFTGLCQEGGSSPLRTSDSFIEIRELARRFALLFGPGQMRNRHDMVLLHKEGIKFSIWNKKTPAWSPQNLLFLDVLSEFSHKLLRQDKSALLKYLDETCKQCLLNHNVNDEDVWAPLQAYKKSLCADEEASASAQVPTGPDNQALQAPPTKRIKTSKETAKDSSLFLDKGRHKLPLMTSTALKERKAPSKQTRQEEEEGSDADFESSSIQRFQKISSSLRRVRAQTRTPTAASISLRR
ncbi:hypothetical protein GDO86_019672 [Hymenochirus boettgeri]|uniref:Cohesin subunit SA n=1 Tax=Hymenochirus boettgeri TaxID=247094 RepID=A0A8T2IK82_9PIPI|nr:hypothetical protein GDO86_019672 [Hymenochirus boettgeri]